jgi:hypothetical protein
MNLDGHVFPSLFGHDSLSLSIGLQNRHQRNPWRTTLRFLAAEKNF